MRKGKQLDFKKHPATDFRDLGELDEKEAKREIEALREGIDYHDHLYYVESRPRISDERYDRLFARLRELEEAFPRFASPVSPTRRVGAPPVDRLARVRHAASMLSLSAAFDEKKAAEFDRLVRKKAGGGRVAYALEPKFDGLSVEVVYEDGVFARGATRGDGRTGEDISANVRTIGTVPLRLRPDSGFPPMLAVRGEILMSKKGFQRLNRRRLEAGEEPFANPRNAAAGTMRQLDSRKVADMPLEAFFYEIIAVEGNGTSSHGETLKAFAAWGLRTSPLNEAGAGPAAVRRYHRKLAARREDLDVEIDGIVAKVDDHELREKLGSRERNPRWALAWKFRPKQQVTVVRDIVVQVGRTGKLTPVALLEPVDVGGVTVSRATLHNEDELSRKDVRIGDRVRIQRAGDVIPEVTERVPSPGKKRARRFAMPAACPSCGAEVYREGAYHLCPSGLSCRAQLLGRLRHYASRGAMDIEGLGERTAGALIDKGLVRDIADLYALEKEDLRRLEGFAAKAAGNLYAAIRSSRKAPLERLVYALGIRGVGRRTASVLSRRFGDLGSLRKATREQLEATEEIGPETASAVIEFFADRENRRVLDRLRQAGVKGSPAPRRRRKPSLSGTTVVFTGELEGWTRREAEEEVERRGGRATSSVSGSTDFLVAGADPGSKLDEARKKGAKVVDEQGFRQLLGGAP